MKVPFSFQPLDSMLGGGLEPGIITMIYGEAGTGKTNLCLVLARSVAASGKRVVYVDSEGVSPDRVSQVFAGSPDLVRRILFYRPVTLWEQEHAISQGTKPEDIGLIVVDTFNMMVRVGNGDGGSRPGKSLEKQLGKLHRTARERDIPVVMTGQVFGGGGGSSGDDRPRVYFGGSVEHVAKIVLFLEKSGINLRRAVLMKHRSLPEGISANFMLCDSGICEE